MTIDGLREIKNNNLFGYDVVSMLNFNPQHEGMLYFPKVQILFTLF
jgi:hypothetical protein